MDCGSVDKDGKLIQIKMQANKNANEPSVSRAANLVHDVAIAVWDTEKDPDMVQLQVDLEESFEEIREAPKGQRKVCDLRRVVSVGRSNAKLIIVIDSGRAHRAVKVRIVHRGPRARVQSAAEARALQAAKEAPKAARNKLSGIATARMLEVSVDPALLQL